MKKLFLAMLALVGIVGLGYIALQAIKMNTKKYSPEATAVFPAKGTPLVTVNYCQPSKKGRTIFGPDGLVPDDIVWRTGSNEATLITFAKDVRIGDSTLKAGTYSLFTIPNPHEWIIIFNEEVGQWGTQYSPNSDILRTPAPSSKLDKPLELFTIKLKGNKQKVSLILMWDYKRVSLPIEIIGS